MGYTMGWVYGWIPKWKQDKIWANLMYNTTFPWLYETRWKELRNTTLSTQSMLDHLNTALPNISQVVTYQLTMDYWVSHVQLVQTFIQEHAAWIDANIHNITLS